MKNAPHVHLSDADLGAAPFSLDAEAIRWVRETAARLDPDAQLRQLFNLLSMNDSADEARSLSKKRAGGVTRFVGGNLEAAWEATRILVDEAEVPLLISGDLEGGAIALPCATPLPNQLGLAAADDAALHEAAIGVLSAEGRALGFNWSFTPVVDLNHEHRSAIVATRSYGSDRQRVREMCSRHLRVMQAHGLAGTLKHWPGEGFDARDQHLVTTINPLDMARWQAEFGDTYQTLIDEGAKCVMSAHIALPAWAAECGAEGLELYRPAVVSKPLNLDLLRGRLGFNGLIVSDATGMAGLSSWAPRSVFVPELIENGCDMILFAQDLEGDLAHLRQALADGRLTQARVDAALLRVLALKASLGLHRGQAMQPLAEVQRFLRNAENQRVAKDVAAASVSLVKDVQGLLPLSPQRHRRVVLVTDPQRHDFVNQGEPAPLLLRELLQQRGFEVREFSGERMPTPADTDLVLYVLAQESLLTVGHIELDWRRITGNLRAAMTRFWHEIPCALISFGHPYYLFDAPRMPCVINAYCGIDAVQEAVLRKLLGEEPFEGIHPVDPFCGLADARY